MSVCLLYTDGFGLKSSVRNIDSLFQNARLDSKFQCPFVCDASSVCGDCVEPHCVVFRFQNSHIALIMSNIIFNIIQYSTQASFQKKS